MVFLSPSMSEHVNNELRVERDDAGSEPKWVRAVRDQVQSLRFGTVLISVHEGRVVQVERTERLRFEHEPSSDTKKPSGTTGAQPNRRGHLHQIS
jgi:hypothetical protein